MKIIFTDMPVIMAVIFILVLVSCTGNESNQQSIDLTQLPVETPGKIVELDEAGGEFFQHLNYFTVLRENGNVLVNDREGAFIAEINPEGKFLGMAATEGRGPGEIQDVLSMSIRNGELLLYDQRRKRVIQKTFKEELVDEFDGIRSGFLQPSEVYHTSSDRLIISKLWSTAYLETEDRTPEISFTVSEAGNTEILHQVTYPSKNYARVFVDGNVVGATAVPFAPDLLYDIGPDFGSMYVFWSENDRIAELSTTTLDTIRTISMPLSGEQVRSVELDSLKDAYGVERWKDLKNHIPEVKALADKMLIDDKNRFWLKLNRYSDHQEWLVADRDGKPLKIVQFPKGVMVTHVSSYHIGVRLDDHLFALYEPVSFPSHP